MTFSKKSPDTNLKLLSLWRVLRVFALAPLLYINNVKIPGSGEGVKRCESNRQFADKSELILIFIIYKLFNNML